MARRIRERLAFWRWFLFTYRPIAGAEEADPAPDPEPDPDPDPDPNPDDAPPEKSAEDYRRELRAYERNAKKASAKKDKEIEDLKAKLSEREEAEKTDQEKAVDEARKQAAEEAKKELLGTLREERLSAAIARHAADSFADVDDAIRLLDTDDDDLFDDDGKPQGDAVKAALEQLLERKPHLKKPEKSGGGDPGDPGAGKGGTAPSPEEMSVEDHLKAIRRHSD